MGFTSGVAIVSASDVAAITLEAGLGNFDDASSGATLANALIKATDHIIVDLRRRRNVDPALVNNTTEFAIAASYKVAAMRFSSLAESDPRRIKASEYEAKYLREIDTVVIVGPAGEQTMAPLGLPRSLNLEPEPTFRRSVENRPPGRNVGPVYRTV